MLGRMVPSLKCFRHSQCDTAGRRGLLSRAPAGDGTASSGVAKSGVCGCLQARSHSSVRPSREERA
jgi:hypothetical protein